MTLVGNLLDLQIPQSVKISPGGRQILYSSTAASRRGGEPIVSTLWLAESGKSNSSRKITSGTYHDTSPRWAPDGDRIAFISDRGKPGESSAIYVLNTTSQDEAYPITPAKNERSIDRFEFSPNGRFICYTSADEKSDDEKTKELEKDDAEVWGEGWQYNRLRLVDVQTKQVVTLISHEAHVIDFSWNDDGTEIAVGETRTPHVESGPTYGVTVSIVNVSNNQLRGVCTFPTPPMDLTWAGDTLYFIGRSKPEVVTASKVVYSVNLCAEPATIQSCAYGEHECASALQKAGSNVTVLVQHGMEDKVCMLKGKTLFSANKAIDAWDAQWSGSDDTVLAIVQSETDKPAEVFTVMATPGESLVQLSNHGAALAERKMGFATFLSCPSADGKETIDAVYLTPGAHARSHKPLPTAVIIHGGPYNRCTDKFDATCFMWTPIILSQGYGVLLPNYRGGSSHGQRFASYAEGRVGIEDYADVVTLTQHAIEAGLADRDRLVVGGWSHGGTLSYLGAVRNGLHGHGWRFRGAIPGAALVDLDTMSLVSDLGSVLASFAGVAPWRNASADTSARAASAVFEFAAAVRSGGVVPPMLILHGGADKRVPVEQAGGMRRALEEAGLPFEMVVYPREGHGIVERKHLADMWDRLARFLDVHIGGK